MTETWRKKPGIASSDFANTWQKPPAAEESRGAELPDHSFVFGSPALWDGCRERFPSSAALPGGAPCYFSTCSFCSLLSFHMSDLNPYINLMVWQ